MRRITTVVVSLAVLAPMTPSGHAAPRQEPIAKPTVVRKVVHRPKTHRTIVRHFTPYATPTYAQAHQIAAAEASRFGCSYGTLDYRISHESGWNWNAANGQYRGLGQFASSTFYRGVSTMPRDVRLVERSSSLRRTKIARLYSDGSVRRGRGRLVRVIVTHIRKGWIPRSPAHTHGWAQVRIMCQALAGRSAVHASEWPARY